MNTNHLSKLSLCIIHCAITIVITVLHLFLIKFLNCYSAIRLLSRRCEIKLSSVQLMSY